MVVTFLLLTVREVMSLRQRTLTRGPVGQTAGHVANAWLGIQAAGNPETQIAIGSNCNADMPDGDQAAAQDNPMSTLRTATMAPAET